MIKIDLFNNALPPFSIKKTHVPKFYCFPVCDFMIKIYLFKCALPPFFTIKKITLFENEQVKNILSCKLFY